MPHRQIKSEIFKPPTVIVFFFLQPVKNWKKGYLSSQANLRQPLLNLFIKNFSSWAMRYACIAYAVSLRGKPCQSQLKLKKRKCHRVYKSFECKLFLFPYMVLSKTEYYSQKLCFTRFNPLGVMKFQIDVLNLHESRTAVFAAK